MVESKNTISSKKKILSSKRQFDNNLSKPSIQANFKANNRTNNSANSANSGNNIANNNKRKNNKNDTGKNETDKNERNANIINFIISVVVIVLFVILHFFVSSILLYACKLSQSNILPTEQDCFPYTDTKPIIESVLINIFKYNAESMKIQFPYDEYNSKNSILDIFREYKNKPNSNFLANYFISVFESLICFNYSAFNFVLNAFNKTFSEMVILLIGPQIMSCIIPIIFFLNLICFVIFWITNMSWFFKKNTSSESDEKPIWKNVTLFDTTKYITGIFLSCIFLSMLFFIIFFALPIIPSLAMAFCIFSLIGYKALMNNKEITAINIIKDVFKHYKITIMSYFSVFIIISAFVFLGNTYGAFTLLIGFILLMRYLIMGKMNVLFNNNFSPLSSYNQANKTCNIKVEKPPLSLFNTFTSFFKGGGKDIVKELKKMNKSK
jgi:hypothetical protein